MKITYYVGLSLDGFIAGSRDELAWLKSVERVGEDYGYADFLSSIDAINMGRRTYEAIRQHKRWPYESKRCIVHTRGTLVADPRVEFTAASPSQLREMLAAQRIAHVWLVGGGEVAGAYLTAGLIDEMVLSTVPVVLGDGIRVSSGVHSQQRRAVQFTPTHTRRFLSGLVQAHYQRCAVAL